MKFVYGLGVSLLILIVGVGFLISQLKQSDPIVSQNLEEETSQNQVLPSATPAIALERTSEEVPKPKVELVDLEGNVVTLANFSGKPTLLKIGTTYCHVCQEEIPEMKQVYKDLGREANIVFVLLGASSIEAKSYVKKHSIEYPVYLDKNQVTGTTFEVLGTPTHAFLDNQGYLALRQAGFLDTKQISTVLKQLM